MQLLRVAGIIRFSRVCGVLERGDGGPQGARMLDGSGLPAASAQEELVPW